MFEIGDTVVFDPDSFDMDYWDTLSEEAKIIFWGELGYGEPTPKLLVFMCELSPQSGHCVLMELESGKMHNMRHTDNFRKATEEEC